MAKMTRRRFLLAMTSTAIAGSAAVYGLRRGLPLRTDSASPLTVFTHTGHALGASVSITALHAEAAIAQRAAAAAFAELERVESVMSIYRPTSELSWLNRTGSLAQPNPLFVHVLRHAQETSRATDGAFDVTVQPLWHLYASAAKAGRTPEAHEIEAALSLVGWRDLEVNDDLIRLKRPGMAITLNGIAQGFAADRVMEILREHGIEHALVDAGELSALGHKEAREPWTIGIQHPREPDAFVSLAQLDNRCLATSGDYATSFTDDKRDNHVFDPRTGHSPTEFSSVSIAAPTAMQADALSTAVFVLGVEHGLDLIEGTHSVDAFVVRKDGRVIKTKGFPVSA